jgi:hypothetical protein
MKKDHQLEARPRQLRYQEHKATPPKRTDHKVGVKPEQAPGRPDIVQRVVLRPLGPLEAIGRIDGRGAGGDEELMDDHVQMGPGEERASSRLGAAGAVIRQNVDYAAKLSERLSMMGYRTSL